MNKSILIFIGFSVWLICTFLLLVGCGITSDEPRDLAFPSEQTALQQTQQAATEKTNAIDPQLRRMTEEMLGTQRADIYERIQATEDLRKSQVEQQEMATLAANENATAIMINTAHFEELKKNLVWKADFETGNLSQFRGKGDFLNQGSGMYNMITFTHRGYFATSLTIDTNAPSETGSHAAYLFFWKQLPDDAYYYSAWYFLPTEVQVQEWWTIMQWKSTYDGNSDHSIRVFSVGVQEAPEGLRIVLNQRPRANEEDGNNVAYTQDISTLPINQWFQIEVYYKRASDNTGQVILWKDGKELFNISDTMTAFSDNTTYWSVHNYSNGLNPSPLSIYIDDMAVSKVQVGNRALP